MTFLQLVFSMLFNRSAVSVQREVVNDDGGWSGACVCGWVRGVTSRCVTRARSWPNHLITRVEWKVSLSFAMLFRHANIHIRFLVVYSCCFWSVQFSVGWAAAIFD